MKVFQTVKVTTRSTNFNFETIMKKTPKNKNKNEFVYQTDLQIFRFSIFTTLILLDCEFYQRFSFSHQFLWTKVL